MHQILFAALAPMLWGSTYAAVGLFLTDISPLWVAAWRALGAGLLLFIILRRLPRMSFYKVFVLSLFNIVLFFILLMFSAYRLPGSIAGTLAATLPLLMILIQWVVQRKTPQLMSTLSAITGLCGVLLLLNPSAQLDWLGVMCALSATFIIAIATLLTRHWQVNDVLGVATWQLLIGGSLLVPIAWLSEGAPVMIGVQALPVLFWLVVLNTALGYILAVNAIRHIGPNAFAMLSLLNPIVAVVLGMFLLQERLDGLQWLGIAIVFLSLLAANVKSFPSWQKARLLKQSSSKAV